MKVYVVTWGVPPEDIEAIWENQEDAERQAAELNAAGDQMWAVEEWEVLPSPSAASSQEKTESGSTAPRRRRKAGGPSR